MEPSHFALLSVLGKLARDDAMKNYSWYQKVFLFVLISIKHFFEITFFREFYSRKNPL
jgi:hypothetical protein